MEIRKLYKYIRGSGGITVSITEPDVEYTTMFRIIASDGMALTRDGVELFYCADVDTTEGWYEVDIEEEGV